MSRFFCCFGKPADAKGDDDSKPKEAISSTIQSSSPNVQAGCCCYRCLVNGSQNRNRRRSRYMFLKKAPEVRDAAVDTEIDFGIVLHDFFKADHITYADCYGEPENEDSDIRDHKYASIQFDSKPGKVKYIEGSQVFYVEVRDKKMAQLRKSSCDKSISEEEEFGMDSDLSGDILCDNRSESQRRLISEVEAKSRKKFGDNSNHGIVYVSNKSSPANSIDSLTDKKANRSFLGNIEETQEQLGEYNLHSPKFPNMTSKDIYNIDGGHFAQSLVTPDEVDGEYGDANKRSEFPSASVSVQSCIQISQDEPGEESKRENYEESEFADVSSQSIPEIQQLSDQDLYTPTVTPSSESNDEKSIPREYFQKALCTLDWPLPKSLTDDPSMLLVTDQPCSLTSFANQEKVPQESSSCPDMSFRSESVYSSSLSTIENSVTAETANIEIGHSTSAETQTDLFYDDNESNSSMTAERPKRSVNSVETETEFDSRDDDTLEESSKKDTDQVSSSKVNSATESNNSENDQSTSYLENLSSTDSDCETSLGESDSSSNSDDPPTKKSPSNSEDSSSSSSSSSSKSTRNLNTAPHRDKESKRARNKKHSSSSSLEGSSGNSSSNCALTSSSSICSSFSGSNGSDSAKDGSNVDLRNGNG